ncbi:MFS transporter [bacterium]|nr:MFS transporter [bacterium]
MAHLAPPTGQDYYDPADRWHALIPIALVSIASTLNSSVINVSLPVIAVELRAGIGVIDWVIQAYLLATTSLLMISGRLGDLLGRRRIYQSGILVFTVGSALCGISGNMTALIAARVFQGVGAALIISVGPAIIGEIFPPDSRGKALGILGTTVAVGLSIGPVVGGIITDLLGWRYIFYLNIPFGVLAMIMVSRSLRKDSQFTRAPFDVAGAVTMAVGLFCLLLLFSRGNDWGWTSPKIIVLAAAAFLCPILFIRSERTAADPILDLTLFSHKTFSSATSAGFLAFTALFTQTFLLPFYLIDLRGHTTAEAGLFLMAVPLIMALVAPVSGTLSDKVGTKWLCVVGMMIQGISFIMLAFLSTVSSTLYIVSALLLTGFGIGMFNPPNNADLLSSVPRNRLGNASGMLGLTRTLGMTFGVAVSSLIFVGVRKSILNSMGLAEADPLQAPQAFLGGLHWVFWTGAAISWLAGMMVFRREKRQ